MLQHCSIRRRSKYRPGLPQHTWTEILSAVQWSCQVVQVVQVLFGLVENVSLRGGSSAAATGPTPLWRRRGQRLKCRGLHGLLGRGRLKPVCVGAKTGSHAREGHL